MVTNHANLWIFLTTKSLSRREACWWEWLFRLDMVIEYQPDQLNLANSLSCHNNYKKKDKPAALAKILQDATESVSWLSWRHLKELVGRKWSRTQTIVPFPSTSDRAILTYFSTPVDPRQGEALRNMSDSREASLRVLTQNAHFFTDQEQESSMFPASTEEALFGQKSRRARQKKKAPISNLPSINTPTKEPQRPDNGPWQFCLKRPEDL